MPRKIDRRIPKVILWTPQAFDPTDLLPTSHHRYSDHARFILSTIIREQDRLKKSEDPQAEYVPLHSSLLRHYIPHPGAGQLMGLLLALGVIECDGRFVPGEKSKGYRLAPDYRTDPVPILCQNARLARKIKDRHDGVTLPIHHHLKLNLERLEIDPQEANRTLEELKEAPAPRRRRRGKSKAPAAYRLGIYRRAIAEIEAGDWRYKVDGYGRNHSNLTSLPRVLRKNLKVAGETLAYIDIRNSQPLIFNLELMTEEREEWAEGEIIYQSSPTGDLKTPSTQLPNRTITQVGISQPETPKTGRTRGTQRETSYDDGFVPLATSGQSMADEVHYRRLCEEGRLYEFLMSRLPQPTDRETFKDWFMAGVLYGRLDQPNRVSRVFAEAFPTVLSKIHAMKRENYRHLAHRLQRRESGLVVETIAARFAQENPQAFIATIHDCLVVRQSDRQAAERIVREEFARVGLSITLHPG